MATPTCLELRKKSSARVLEAEALQAKADGEGRPITSEEEAEILRALEDSRQLLAQADLRQRTLNERARHGDRPTAEGRPTDTMDLSSIEKNHPSTPDSRWGGGARPSALDAVRPRRYSELFPGLRCDAGGFESTSEFLRTIALGLGDPRLQYSAAAASGFSTKIGSEGGFLVPSALSAQFLDSSLEGEVIRPRARIFPTDTDKLSVGGFDVHDGTNPAGLGLSWQAEGAEATRKVGKIRTVTYNLSKCSIYCAVSNELLSDASGFETALSLQLSQSLAQGFDDSFINGTGAGQPLGILKADSLVTVSKEGSQAANTIRFENLTKMWARLLPRSASRAVWLAHPSTLPQLMALTVPVKNLAGSENVGGGFIPVLRDGPGGAMTILGAPLLITEKCQPLSSKGDLILVDLSLYGIALRSEAVIERSNAPGWLADQVDFRIKLRLDGGPLMGHQAYTPKHGTDTLSWAVTLEAR